jgi:hypothetical protein
MTNKQAQFLLKDWGSNLLPEDYCETIQLSIKGVGTRMFKQCCYHESDEYVFIWTVEESFIASKKDLGDFVSLYGDLSKRTLLSLKKVI